LGGEGDDHIDGGGGADILLGGLGQDRLLGNTGDDILVGDRTLYDSDQSQDRLMDVNALLAILAEWTSGKSYAERRGNITGTNPQDGRLNNGYYFRLGDTIWGDADEDELTGGSGDDWFFVCGRDRVTDWHKGRGGETVATNTIDARSCRWTIGDNHTCQAAVEPCQSWYGKRMATIPTCWDRARSAGLEGCRKRLQLLVTSCH
jgi:hypothetical protein